MGAEVIMFVALFAAVFGIYFLRSRENLAMIEKGINPRKSYPAGPKPYAYMKYSLLLVGAGIGLFAAFMIDATYLHDVWINKSPDGTTVYHKDTSAIYFALLAIGGGIGLFLAYLLEKKHMVNNNTSSGNE